MDFREPDYEKIARELRILEEEFWRAWGEPLMDGSISEHEYRARLSKFAIESYRLGLLSAASIIEKRTQNNTNA